jgi:ribosomal protein S18 acetylase RimI-like enzyme
MEVSIEKLTLQNLDAFWELFAQTIRHDFPGYSQSVVDYFLTRMYSQYNFQQWLMTGWKIILAAYAKAAKGENCEKIVGFAVLDKPYGGVCFLRWLGVRPEYRKKGVGKKLIFEWEKYSRGDGCHKIEVASQPEAKKFYQKAGLRLEGKRRQSYFGIDQYIFGKVIGRPDDVIMTRD